jgi:hypothetical protein
MRRNPLAWAGLAAAALALTAFGVAQAVQSARLERVRRARAIYAEAQPLAAQAILAVHAGDASAGERLMKEFVARLDAARRADPEFDAGWFERAQFMRAVGDEESAWADVEEGLKREPGSAIGRLERGILLAARYRREFRRAAGGLERSEREAAERELRPPRRIAAADVEADRPGLAELRGRAIAELDAGASGIGADPPDVRLARGAILALRGDLAEADARLKGLEWPEAKVLRGSICEARDYLSEAEDWYGRAIATRESYLEGWEARAAVRVRRAERLWKPGTREGLDKLDEAISDWTRLVDASPARADLRASRAAALWRLGQMLVYLRADPRPPSRRAAEDASEALRLDPGEPEARLWLGRAWLQHANWDASTGDDPRPAFRAAIEALAAEAAARPEAFDPVYDLASARRMLAFWLRRTGNAGHEEESQLSLKDFDRALALRPRLWHAHANRGHLLCELGRWKEGVEALEAAKALLNRPYEPLDRALEEARERVQ